MSGIKKIDQRKDTVIGRRIIWLRAEELYSAPVVSLTASSGNSIEQGKPLSNPLLFHKSKTSGSYKINVHFFKSASNFL